VPDFTCAILTESACAKSTFGAACEAVTARQMPSGIATNNFMIFFFSVVLFNSCCALKVLSSCFRVQLPLPFPQQRLTVKVLPPRNMRFQVLLHKNRVHKQAISLTYTRGFLAKVTERCNFSFGQRWLYRWWWDILNYQSPCCH
jgi:hypothetical protein